MALCRIHPAAKLGRAVVYGVQVASHHFGSNNRRHYDDSFRSYICDSG